MNAKKVLLFGFFTQLLVGVLGILLFEGTLLLLNRYLDWKQSLAALFRIIASVAMFCIFIQVRNRLKDYQVIVYMSLLIILGAFSLTLLFVFGLLTWIWPNSILSIFTTIMSFVGLFTITWYFVLSKIDYRS